MPKPKELPQEEETEEQRVAQKESIFQEIEGFLGVEFTPAEAGNGGEQQVRFRIKDKRATLSIFFHPEEGKEGKEGEEEMRADIRLLVQGGDKVFIFQIPDAFVRKEKDGIIFSENSENGTGFSLSIKEDGKIVPSPFRKLA